MNVLFIGGPLDGERLAIADGMRTYYAHERALAPTVRAVYEAPKKIEYREETLRDKEGRDYVVMVCCGENIIERLLNGYAPNASLEGRAAFGASARSDCCASTVTTE